MVFKKSACIEPMYQEVPFLDRFQSAKENGFDYVEFWSWTDKDLRAVRHGHGNTRLIGSPMLKVLYDVYHMQLNEGSLCDNIRAYSDQFGHIHVADAPGRHEPGTGEIHYEKVFSCLEESGYTGLIGFELIPATTTAQAVKAIMQYR